MTIPVYIINLEKDKDRWKNVCMEMKKSNIVDFNRIDAVYGKKLSKDQLERNTTTFGRLFSTLPTIGTAMSHIKSWETIVAENNQNSLIFEDDVILEPNFQEKLNTILTHVPKDFDILYLGCDLSNYDNKDTRLHSIMKSILGTKYKKNHKKINKSIFVPESPLALHSYILSKNGARKLLNIVRKTKIYSHIDYMLLREGKDLKVYASNPFLVFQDIDRMTSNISSSYPLVLNKLLSKKIDMYKIPLSYRLSVPIIELLGIPVNGLNIILFILAIGYGIFYNMEFETVTLFYIIYNLIELFQDYSNYLIIIKLYCLILVGIYIGSTL
jgi:glycosyl transferase family 25